MADNQEWSPTKDATERTQVICNEVKGQVKYKTGKDYEVYKAVKYRDRGVEEILIKVHVGGVNYIHLFVTFPPTQPCPIVILAGVEQHKTKDDPLVPFSK